MDASPAEGSRKRNQTACEACRATKLRCVPSETDGICQKCLISKRECVSRTGPRTRRPRRSKHSTSTSQGNPPPPPPKPSDTFNIDFAIPSRQDIDENFEILRASHTQFLDNLFPDPQDTPELHRLSDMPLPSATPAASSSTHSHSIQDLHAKPTFNLVSAASLLDTFRSMLAYCPLIVLPHGATVPQLSASRPFVLLATLAAASGSRTLQGHNLYDEEFRKVLALKMVAGGEQSIELLQGILIYCMWYPFHLRPKNKQVFQYTRMAADLVHDLDLDQDQRIDNPDFENDLTAEQMDGIRAYVAQYYLSSAFGVTWQARRTGSATFTSWTAHCCDVLERHAQVPGDAVLANLTRLGSTVCDAWTALRYPSNTSFSHNDIVFLGLEAQFNEQQAAMCPDVAAAMPIHFQTLFTKFFLSGAPLLHPPRKQPLPPTTLDQPSPTKLHTCVETLKQLLALISNISEPDLSHFSTSDWGRLVLVVVAGMRLSFPQREMPGLDSATIRSELNFEAFLDNMSAETDLTPAAKKVDIVSASRVVMGVVRDKYRRRLAQVEAGQRQGKKSGVGCPMLDGSLEGLLPTWDTGNNFCVDPSTSGFDAGLLGSPLYGDEWAAMAMGFAGLEDEHEGMPLLQSPRAAT